MATARAGGRQPEQAASHTQPGIIPTGMLGSGAGASLKEWKQDTRMILGIGSDLIDIRRIEQTLERHGDRFIQRIFTDIEKGKAARRGSAGPTLAKRFAAKEACSKALGTGINRGVFFKDMGVVNLPSGQPTLHLTGGAKARLEAMVPQGMTARIHLTITDDYPLAQAFVVIEAVSG